MDYLKISDFLAKLCKNEVLLSIIPFRLFQERQEATEKSLKHQLAKTHSVLKKTNKISSKYQDQNRPPLGENA